nr:hypothetical protein [Kribbella sandramycini]
MIVLAEGRWPEPGDDVPPGVPGFIGSAFSPLAAAAAGRCLERTPEAAGATGIVLETAGDRDSATQVAELVAAGKRVGPLWFFQSVPNSIAGWIAARWDLRGPVVCVTDGGTDEAALLIGDGDADRVLIVQVEADQAFARIVTAGDEL